MSLSSRQKVSNCAGMNEAGGWFLVNVALWAALSGSAVQCSSITMLQLRRLHAGLILDSEMQESTADELEEAYRSGVWLPERGRLTNFHGTTAAKVELLTLANELKASQICHS